MAEQLRDVKQLTCGSLSLFGFEPGQYECSGLCANAQLLTRPLNSAASRDRASRFACVV